MPRPAALRGTALLLLGTALATPALAQQRDAQTDEDPATVSSDRVIVVTGTARSGDILTTPADVTILDDERLERERGTSLGDTLDGVAGFDSIGAGDQVGKPVIRGLSGQRVRILSDDLPLDFQQYGVRHPANVEPFFAERIEIVRGASSILYGSDAIGGVVNIISRRPPSAAEGEIVTGGRLTGEYQSAYREYTGALQVEGAAGPLGVTTTVVRRSSDGLVTPEKPTALETGDVDGPLVTGDIPFTDFDQINAAFALGYETGRGQVVLRYERWRNEHNFVVPDPPPPNGNPLQAGGVGQDLENDIVHLFADLDVGGGITLIPHFGYSKNVRISNPGPPEPLGRDFLPGAQVINIERENYYARLEAQHGQVFGLLSGRLGFQYEHVDQFSKGSTALNPGGQVDRIGVFALEEATFGRLIVNLGARFDHISVEGDPGRTVDDSGLPADPALLQNDYSVFSGSLGVVYRLADDLSLTANVARGFRAPTLFELYVNGQHGGVAAIQRGDPNIDKETAINADASIRYRNGDTLVKLTGYVNSIDDYIFPAGTGQNAPNGLPIFQITQEDAELYGADLEVELAPVDWLRLRGKAQYVEGELDSGFDLPLLPPFKAQAEAELRAGSYGALEDTFASVGFRYASSQESAGVIEPFNQFDGAPPPFGTASTDSYFLTDIGVGANLGPLDVSLRANNVFDVAYRDFLDTYKNITLSPGRNIVLNVSVGF